MTRETKYGIVALIGLATALPLFMLTMHIAAKALLLIIEHPLPVLTGIIGMFIGDYLKGKFKH